MHADTCAAHALRSRYPHAKLSVLINCKKSTAQASARFVVLTEITFLQVFQYRRVSLEVRNPFITSQLIL